MFCSRYVEWLIPLPRAKPRPRCLTDQTVQAGDLVPRCNEVGRTLGGRDKDKMTDCPMVLALTLEGKIRDLSDPFNPFPRRRRYNHAQQRPDLFLMSDQWQTGAVVCGLTLLPTCPLQTKFSHHPVIYGLPTMNMISSVRCCTLGVIIAGLNGDASIALVRESANFDRRRGSEVATKYLCGSAARDGRETPCPTVARSCRAVGGGWTPSHIPKNNGGTRSAAHKRCRGGYLYLQ